MINGLRLQLRQSGPIALDAHLDCAPGEVLALVGPSGSGKSTLLRSIAGLYQPQSGKIECAGECWFDSTRGIALPTSRRRIGMLFQQFALFPHLSAEDNVAEALLDHPATERRARARDWLDRVHLQGLHHRLPHQLSGGQQQRVALARALAREPQVLLLDEPFSAVDRSTREALHAELTELRVAFRMPVILVTHDLEEATLLADRMCILNEGRCCPHAGHAQHLYRHPAGSRSRSQPAALERPDAESQAPQAFASRLRSQMGNSCFRCLAHAIGRQARHAPGQSCQCQDSATAVTGRAISRQSGKHRATTEHERRTACCTTLQAD